MTKNVSKYPKILLFQGVINNRGNGQLLLIDSMTARIDATFKARSGIGGKENQKAYGPIPSNELIRLIHYQVIINPLWLNKPGINGNFYQIKPFSVKIDNIDRGDFGIHLDGNNNGTLGCIGIDPSDWNKFKNMMGNLKNSGLLKVPLLVDNL